jgi:hypothetical protein
MLRRIKQTTLLDPLHPTQTLHIRLRLNTAMESLFTLSG